MQVHPVPPLKHDDVGEKAMRPGGSMVSVIKLQLWLPGRTPKVRPDFVIYIMQFRFVWFRADGSIATLCPLYPLYPLYPVNRNSKFQTEYVPNQYLCAPDGAVQNVMQLL